MKEYITIYMIDNGFLAVEKDHDGQPFRSVYLKDINMDQLVGLQEVDHEAVLRALIKTADGKIAAIKAVRTYIRSYGLDRSDGLKDVKDYVEALRSDWPSQWEHGGPR